MGEKVIEDFMKRVRDSGVPSITVALADLNTGLAGRISRIFERRCGEGARVRGD